MKTVNVPERLIEPVVGFIAESLEIIDGEWGKKRTYEQLEEAGLVVEDIKAFMTKFKEYRPVTQAQQNLITEEEEKDKRLEENGVLTVEIEE